MAWRNRVVWILSGLVFIALVYLSYSYGTSNPSKKILDNFVQKYEKIISEKDTLISEKETQIKESEEKYKLLVDKIKKKAAQAQNIKPPTTTSETKRRFNEAGYPPINK
jgi:DNA-binding protein H-NS